MKIIFDNIIFYLQRSGGGTIYWYELIKRAALDSDLEVLFSEPKAPLFNKFRLNFNINVNIIEQLPLNLLRICNFSKRMKERTIFHSSYYRISKSKHAINIVTIHDFTSELYFSGLRRFVHTLRKKIAIKHATGIICISNNTKKDLLNMYPWVKDIKMKVIYNGVSDEYFPIKHDEIKADFEFFDILKEKYILYVGHRTNYKNFPIVSQIISKLDPSYKLLIIGEKLTPAEKEQLDAIIPKQYICLSEVTNYSLNVFYNFAHSLIYPSSYEGFGIPILEAMKAGCPVVTTNKSSIPEVAGDAAIMASEINADVFVNAIRKLEDPIIRNELINKGFANASKYSWEQTYQEVKEFYKELFTNEKVF